MSGNKFSAIHAATSADAKRVASEHPVVSAARELCDFVRKGFDGPIHVGKLRRKVEALESHLLALQAESIAEALSINEVSGVEAGCNGVAPHPLVSVLSTGDTQPSQLAGLASGLTSPIRTAIDPLAELGTRGLR